MSEPNALDDLLAGLVEQQRKFYDRLADLELHEIPALPLDLSNSGQVTGILPVANLGTTQTPTFGALNVGTATGAATGDIKASGKLRLAAAGVGIKQEARTLADTNAAQIFATNDRGWVFITDDANASAIFEIRGNSNMVSLLSDPVGVYAIASTAGKTSLEASGAGVYTLRNRRGASRDYSSTLIGRM